MQGLCGGGEFSAGRTEQGLWGRAPLPQHTWLGPDMGEPQKAQSGISTGAPGQGGSQDGQSLTPLPSSEMQYFWISHSMMSLPA